ncbi:hypothetical protein F4780DRAFT_601307 [Xylariomycetidae sp. FL0641]|nr:hypothetical protein F4780DRAFT_601307 [Xylariomycetidae sp. FL0641]
MRLLASFPLICIISAVYGRAQGNNEPYSTRTITVTTLKPQSSTQPYLRGRSPVYNTRVVRRQPDGSESTITVALSSTFIDTTDCPDESTTGMAPSSPQTITVTETITAPCNSIATTTELPSTTTLATSNTTTSSATSNTTTETYLPTSSTTTPTTLPTPPTTVPVTSSTNPTSTSSVTTTSTASSNATETYITTSNTTTTSTESTPTAGLTTGCFKNGTISPNIIESCDNSSTGCAANEIASCNTADPARPFGFCDCETVCQHAPDDCHNLCPEQEISACKDPGNSPECTCQPDGYCRDPIKDCEDLDCEDTEKRQCEDAGNSAYVFFFSDPLLEL